VCKDFLLMGVLVGINKPRVLTDGWDSNGRLKL